MPLSYANAVYPSFQASSIKRSYYKKQQENIYIAQTNQRALLYAILIGPKYNRTLIKIKRNWINWSVGPWALIFTVVKTWDPQVLANNFGTMTLTPSWSIEIICHTCALMYYWRGLYRGKRAKHCGEGVDIMLQLQVVTYLQDLLPQNTCCCDTYPKKQDDGANGA
jgi:hypothetical protein